MLGHGSTTILLASGHPNGMSQISGYHHRLPEAKLSLVRANARALLSHARFRHSEEGVEVCGCGVVAAVTLILLVCCSVYVKFTIKIHKIM